MRTPFIRLVLLSWVLSAEAVDHAVAQSTMTAFVRVNVLPMTSDTVARNPLADLATLRTPVSVVRLGRVYSAKQLDSIRVARLN